ncbi:MAG TPA: sulfotransferase [Verrucomicrobiae bacterium]|nr:sulfotransferase [Verrucomicrobiae bacterium]
MKRPHLVSQGTLNRIFQAAELAWTNRDFQQAIELLERASKMSPASTSILLDLGGAYGRRFRYSDAQECFEKALRLSIRKTDLLFAIGAKCRDFASPELAEHYWKRAVEQVDVSPIALVKLAELYERIRRIPDSEALIEKALCLSPGFPPALLIRARLLRHSGQIEQAEKLLRSFIAQADRETKIRSWYELGAVLDRQSRYDEAMSAFVEAKFLLKADAPPHTHARRVMRSRLKALQENLTPEILQNWANFAPNLSPPRRIGLLCGHPRSGTTLLEQVLDSHSEVISLEETEIFHDEAYMPLARNFPNDAPIFSCLESALPAVLNQSRENYFQVAEQFLGKTIEGRLLIDKNPSLTFLISHFLRIFPEVKLIVAVRDPRDVCLSCFMQPFFPIGQVNSAYLTIEDTVEEYIALMGMWKTISLMIPNRFLEIRYEDMIENFEPLCRKVLNHLNIPWEAKVLRFDKHAQTKAVRSPTYADVTKPIFRNSIRRWRSYEKYLRPYFPKLTPFVDAFAYES